MTKAEMSLFEVVRKSPGSLSLGQLMAATGLPKTEAEPALRSLIRRFRCVLKVTQSGEILYDFGPEAQARITVQERLGAIARAVGHGAQAVARFLFRLGFLGILLIYGTIYILFFIAMLTRGQGLSEFSTPIKEFLKLLGGMALDLVRRREDPVQAVLHPQSDTSDQAGSEAGADGASRWLGFSLATLARRAAGRPWQDRIFAFVFGKGARMVEGRDRDRAFLRHVVACNGFAGASDWVWLFGGDLASADVEVSRLYAQYGADVLVTDGGSIVYDFRSLLRTDVEGAADVKNDAPEPDAFARVEAASWALAHDTPAALLVMGFSFVNLLGAIVLGVLTLSAASPTLRMLLVFVPMGFSIGVFGLLLARGVLWGADQGGRRTMASLLVWLSDPVRPQIPADPAAVLAGLSDEVPPWLREGELRRRMPRANRALGAQLARHSDGEAGSAWGYARLTTEMADLQYLRASGTPQVHVGDVVYSTGSDDPI